MFYANFRRPRKDVLIHTANHAEGTFVRDTGPKTGYWSGPLETLSEARAFGWAIEGVREVRGCGICKPNVNRP